MAKFPCFALAAALVLGACNPADTELKILATKKFRAPESTGRIHCFTPQHYSLGEIAKIDRAAYERASRLIPPEIMAARNVDDDYSIVTVIDGLGIYIRYFGYRTLPAEHPVCW
ncbi:hypothetical protein [Bosea sp. LjRoot237]|uniref:hypothetical protein n=1 Tax=Bosea sp. LjRoot237 TaxID=3342292 RepID=UPI003ECEC310